MPRRKLTSQDEAIAEWERRDAERMALLEREGLQSNLPEPHWWADVDLICALLRIGRTTLWRWIRAGTFPQPFRLGDRSILWRREVVAEWIEAGGARPKIGRPRAR